MDKISSSASKIVFILIAVTTCVGFVIKLLPVDQFMLLATGAFAYYFTKKPDPVIPNPNMKIK